MKYLFYIIILLVAMIGYAIQENQTADFSSLRNFTINETINISTPSQPEVGHIVNSFANALLEIVAGVIRWGVDFAEQNPEGAWRLVIWGVILAILAPILYALIRLIILIVIFTNEIIQRRKEKKIYNERKGNKRDQKLSEESKEAD